MKEKCRVAILGDGGNVLITGEGMDSAAHCKIKSCYKTAFLNLFCVTSPISYYKWFLQIITVVLICSTLTVFTPCVKTFLATIYRINCYLLVLHKLE